MSKKNEVTSMLKNICSLPHFNTIYKALLNEIFCSRETSIDLCENKQSHIFKIYIIIMLRVFTLYIVFKMQYLCINSFCHSRYGDTDALL